MKYEYKSIRLRGQFEQEYRGCRWEVALNVEDRMNKLGEMGWRLIHSENNGQQITYAVMERVSGQDEAQKGRAKFARYIDVPTSGGKWAVMDTTRTHNVNVAVFSTEGEAMAYASHLNEQEKGGQQ